MVALHAAADVTTHCVWRNGIELSIACASPDVASRHAHPSRLSPATSSTLVQPAGSSVTTTTLRATSRNSSASSVAAFLTQLPLSSSSSWRHRCQLRVALAYNPLAHSDAAALSLDVQCIDLPSSSPSPSPINSPM